MTEHRIECVRAEALLASLPDASVNLIATDPPYHRVKSNAWDRQWKTDDDFLAWMDTLCAQWKRVLTANGSLYVFAAPRMGARVECVVRKHLHVLTNIRWRKPVGRADACHKEDLRAPFPDSETIIFAEQYGADSKAMGEAQYDAKCDELRGFVFEPLRLYLDEERKRAGFDRAACDAACGNQMSGHYFSRVQWTLPTKANYERLQRAFNGVGGGQLLGRDYDHLRRDYDHLRREYEDLRREYEDLRREYEDLRRPFFATKDRPYTDVWDFATVQGYQGKHVCEKPADMGTHIVQSSSRPGDVVADFFAGSGTFPAAAAALGRKVIACDMDEHWANITRDRVARSAASGKVEPAIVGRQRKAAPPAVAESPRVGQLALAW